VLRSIVHQARQGDEEAFATLVREVGNRCIFIAHRVLRDANLAEDAVQMALVQVWRELPALRDPDRFDAWLHRILVNACYAGSPAWPALRG
jgi:RNA polymerase sigma-70 factor, ECF subfamily